MANWLRDYGDGRDGAVSIEYAIIAGFLSVAIAVVVKEIGVEVTGLYTAVVNAFN